MSDKTPIEEAPEAVTNRDVAKGAGTTLLARLGGVIEMITQPLYFWLFGLAATGFYGAVWAAVGLAEHVLDLGMTSAMQRVVPQAKSKAEEASALRAALVVGVTPCLIVAGIVSSMAEPVSTFFNTDTADAALVVSAVQLFAWALPLWAFVEISTAALRSKRVFGPEIRLRVLWEQVVRLVLVILFYAMGMGTMSLFLAHLISLAIICLLCLRLLSQHFDLRLMFEGQLVDRMFRESLKAGLAVLPVNIVSRIFADGPAIALNAAIPGTAGAEAAGLYVLARKISSLAQVVRTAFSYVLAPLAAAASRHGRDQIQSIYGFATRLSIALAVPLGAILAASSITVLPLSAPRGMEALFATIALIGARVVEAVAGSATPIQQTTSRHLDQQWGSWIGIAAATMIGIEVLPQHGVTGMSLAVATGLIISAILPLVQLRWIDKLHPFDPPFASVSLRALAVAAVGVLLVLAVQALPVLALRLLLGVLIVALWLKVSRKLALGLAALAVAELSAEIYADLPAWLLPDLLRLVILICLLVAALWASMRLSLPHEDRLAIGPKTAKALKLV